MTAEKSVRVCFKKSGTFKFFNILFGHKKVIHFCGKFFVLELGKNGLLKIGEKNIVPGNSSRWKKIRDNILREIKLNTTEATFLGELLRKHETFGVFNSDDLDLPEWYRLTRMNHFQNIGTLLREFRLLKIEKPTKIISLRRVRIPVNRTKVNAHGILISAFMC